MDTKAQTQPLPREATRSWKYEVEGMKRVDDEHRKVQEVIGQLNERGKGLDSVGTELGTYLAVNSCSLAVTVYPQDLLHSKTLKNEISAVLGQQEAGFLAAYRAHMYNVQKELQALKARAARAENELQKNDKIQKLEEECEWYRKEALRLDEACTAFKKDLVYMKEKLETLEDDRAFLARQLKGAKKHAKLLRAEVDLAREGASQRALFAEGGGEGVGQAWGGGGGGGGGGSQASLGSAGGGGGGGGLLLPDMRLAQSAPSHGLRGPAQQLERVRRDHGYVPQRPATQDPSKRSPKQEWDPLWQPGQARSMPAFLSTGGGGDGPGGSMEEMPQDVTQLQQQVRQLRRALADERRALRAARGAAARRGRRTQLQAFFLECVQDARRAAERRRAAARAAAAKGRPKTHAGSARPGQGPLDSVSSPGRGLDDAQPDHDDPLAGPVGLEDLSATDRRGVMERLLLRDDVADAVYRMVFPDDGGGLPPGAGALTTHGITHDPAVNRELRKYSDRQHRDARQPQSYGPAGDADYMGMEEDDFGFGPGRDDGARARGGAAGSMPALGGGGGGSSSARLLPLSAGTLRYLGKV